MFWQIILLAESLRQNSPNTRLLVCDFGLTEAQKRYLRGQNALLDRPAHLAAEPRHVWYLKAALGHYVRPLGPRAVMWLDTDLIILSDLDALVRRLEAEIACSGAVIAASGRRSITIEDWLGENTQAPGFEGKVRSLGTAVPYLSSGIFLCRSASFLADWERACEALPFELLYEQNAFNLTAWAQPDRVHLLDPDLWNLSGQDIPRTSCVPNDAGFALVSPSGRVHVLHATSTNRMADLVPVHVDITTHGRSCVLPYRVVRHPDVLRDHQIGLFSSGLERELPALVDSGCLDDPPLA